MTQKTAVVDFSTSTCKWKTNKLKNVTNKMCVKTAINAVKEINGLTDLQIMIEWLFVVAAICSM